MATRSLTNPNNNLILLFEFSILSDLFPQYKISLRWRNTHDVIILIAKTFAAFQHNRSRKTILSSQFDTDSDMKVHALRYATYTRQIFLSKLKLLQTRQTSRKNKKQSKTEIGYD